MTTRITDPALADTEKLLGQVLQPILKANDRVLFLCPAGQGESILQRIRVMISRKRKKMRAKGKAPKQFRFRSTIHPETYEGVRYDACVCWHEVSDQNMMSELLDEVMTHA